MLNPMTTDSSLATMHIPQKDFKSLLDVKNEKKMDETAREFEAVFVSEMMKPMFEGLETKGPFGGGQAEETFRSLLLQEYGKIISRTGSLGIAPKIKEAMIKLQEQQSPSPQAVEGKIT